MNFNSHSDLANRHAFLSPSNYHWINYTEDTLEARFVKAMAAKRGTELHDFAHKAIQLGVRLPEEKLTLNMYINDGIGFKMSVEQPLYYSRNCFGHADTICFRNGVLKISDYKSGVVPASEHQLEVYAALFCLEYVISPHEIDIELRIYQNDEILLYEPYPEVIVHLMDKIIHFDQIIEALREEESW